jgi:hypothetical protein
MPYLNTAHDRQGEPRQDKNTLYFFALVAPLRFRSPNLGYVVAGVAPGFCAPGPADDIRPYSAGTAVSAVSAD